MGHSFISIEYSYSQQMYRYSIAIIVAPVQYAVTDHPVWYGNPTSEPIRYRTTEGSVVIECSDTHMEELLFTQNHPEYAKNKDQMCGSISKMFERSYFEQPKNTWVPPETRRMITRSVYDMLRHELAEKLIQSKNKAIGAGGYTPVSKQLEALAKTLPGVDARVKYPCDCRTSIFAEEAALYNIIIHLNDKCDWTREQIADWIETLDIDTRFKSPEEQEIF